MVRGAMKGEEGMRGPEKGEEGERGKKGITGVRRREGR
jgi:hypothetical protein